MTIASRPDRNKPAEERLVRAFISFNSPITDAMAEIAHERIMAARRITALTKRAKIILDQPYSSPPEGADDSHDHSC